MKEFSNRVKNIVAFVLFKNLLFAFKNPLVSHFKEYLLVILTLVSQKYRTESFDVHYRKHTKITALPEKKKVGVK